MKKFTTAKAALGYALLKGQTLNVKNCFSLFGITNCAREVPRMIEQPFGLTVTRTERTGTSRFHQSVSWIDYKLDKASQSPEAIAALQTYIDKHSTK